MEKINKKNMMMLPQFNNDNKNWRAGEQPKNRQYLH